MLKYKLRLIFDKVVITDGDVYQESDIRYKRIIEEIYLPDDSAVLHGAGMPDLIGGEWVLDEEDKS